MKINIDKYKYQILTLIVLVGLILRIQMSLEPNLHVWDEQYHALVAKNISDEPFKPMLYKNPVLDYTYKNWTGNHIWLHKPPITLWSIGTSIILFGPSAFNVRLPSIILSLLSIILCFLIGRIVSSTFVGLFAAFLFSLNGFLLDLCSGRMSTDHVDIHFVTFTLFAVYLIILHEKRKRIWLLPFIGFILGISILTKSFTALFLIPIWFSLHFHQKFSILLKNGLILVIPAMILVIPWIYYTSSSFPLEYRWESQMNFKHFTEAIEGHGRPWYFLIDQIRILYGEYIYLPVAYLIYQLYNSNKKKYYRLLTLWIFVPLIVFSIAITKMPGYTTIIAPALFIITAECLQYIYHLTLSGWRRVLQIVVIISFILLPIRYCIERLKLFQEKQAKVEFPAYSNNQVIFNDPNSIQTMFFTNCAAAYHFVPDAEQRKKVLENGYELIMYQTKE